QTFHGKSFMQVTVYDGPASRQMSMKPLQNAAASDSRVTQPVAGWDRWVRSTHRQPALHAYLPLQRRSPRPLASNSKLRTFQHGNRIACRRQRMLSAALRLRHFQGRHPQMISDGAPGWTLVVGFGNQV